jgi:hypothetical protein
VFVGISIFTNCGFDDDWEEGDVEGAVGISMVVDLTAGLDASGVTHPCDLA